MDIRVVQEDIMNNFRPKTKKLISNGKQFLKTETTQPHSRKTRYAELS